MAGAAEVGRGVLDVGGVVGGVGGGSDGGVGGGSGAGEETGDEEGDYVPEEEADDEATLDAEVCWEPHDIYNVIMWRIVIVRSCHGWCLWCCRRGRVKPFTWWTPYEYVTSQGK